MNEKVYNYIQKIKTSDYGSRHQVLDIKGSEKELENLLKNYNIKSHKISNSDNFQSSAIGVTIVSHQYILIPKIISKI